MRKILLVNDDSAYTWCLQKYLQNRGYRVKTANTLEEARIAIKDYYGVRIGPKCEKAERYEKGKKTMKLYANNLCCLHTVPYAF